MEKNNQLKPLSIKRITELAEGNHAVVGDLERLAITALCFLDENKSTVKAFQSVGFCLLEREQELEAMQQRTEAAEAKLQAERETSDIIMESLRQKEAKLAELAKQEPVAYVHPAYLQAGALGFDASVGRLAPAQIPLFTRPAPAADPAELVPEEAIPDENACEWVDGWNACRAAILRKIEGSK